MDTMLDVCGTNRHFPLEDKISPLNEVASFGPRVTHWTRPRVFWDQGMAMNWKRFCMPRCSALEPPSWTLGQHDMVCFASQQVTNG